MSIFQMRSNASLPIWSARYDVGLIGGLFLAEGSFFAALKPSKSAKLSWSELFALVSDYGSKNHQDCSCTISSCHSLPFFDTFCSKIALNFSYKSFVGWICSATYLVENLALFTFIQSSDGILRHTKTTQPCNLTKWILCP